MTADARPTDAAGADPQHPGEPPAGADKGSDDGLLDSIGKAIAAPIKGAAEPEEPAADPSRPPVPPG